MTNQLKIKIIGKNPNYFLQKIIYERVNIYSLKTENHSLEIIVNQKDYEKIKKMKTSYKITILERYGISKYQFLFKNYFYIFIFIFLGILLNIFLSHIIFEIEIIHPNKQLINIIEKDLQEFGIKKYTFKMNYKQKEQVKNKLLEKEKDILEWIEIEAQGTKYKITLEERKKREEESSCPPRNIISKKNAIILEIQSSSGEIVKKKQDYVGKGEIIISGLIHNKEEIVSKKCAIGQVFGETWYRIKITLPTERIEEEFTNRKQLGLSFLFFHYDFSSHKKFSSFQKKEYNIIEGIIIPIKIGLIKYNETHQFHNVYQEEYLEKEALEVATKTIDKKLQKGEEILEKKVLKKQKKNSKIEVEVFLKVKEDITDYIDIMEE